MRITWTKTATLYHNHVKMGLVPRQSQPNCSTPLLTCYHQAKNNLILLKDWLKSVKILHVFCAINKIPFQNTQSCLGNLKYIYHRDVQASLRNRWSSWILLMQVRILTQLSRELEKKKIKCFHSYIENFLSIRRCEIKNLKQKHITDASLWRQPNNIL